MDKWTAIKKSDLLFEIYMSEQNMNNEELKLWNSIKINPEVWKCNDVIEANFWVVAKNNNSIIWYNDIEEGYIFSAFKLKGEILSYKASKQGLDIIIQKLNA